MRLQVLEDPSQAGTGWSAERRNSCEPPSKPASGKSVKHRNGEMQKKQRASTRSKGRRQQTTRTHEHFRVPRPTLTTPTSPPSGGSLHLHPTTEDCLKGTRLLRPPLPPVIRLLKQPTAPSASTHSSTPTALRVYPAATITAPNAFQGSSQAPSRAPSRDSTHSPSRHRAAKTIPLSMT